MTSTTDQDETSTAKEGEETPVPKKQRTMEDYPVANDEEWPEAWLMADNEDDPDFDQCKPNKRSPDVPVTAAQMRELGILYWKMPDTDKYDYPVKSVPYDPKVRPCDCGLCSGTPRPTYAHPGFVLLLRLYCFPDLTLQTICFFTVYIDQIIMLLDLPSQRRTLPIPNCRRCGTVVAIPTLISSLCTRITCPTSKPKSRRSLKRYVRLVLSCLSCVFSSSYRSSGIICLLFF
jgi:hypothetical protein